MDERSFDALARAVSGGATRRQALRFLAAGALAGLRPWSGQAAPARQADGCAPGFTYCEEQPNWAPAGCYDLSADYLHCGSCMNQCPSAGPVEMACVGGACVVIGCGDLTDCTGNLDCVDLGSDPANCGGCGVVCESGVCEAGACSPAGCPAGSWDCDGNGTCVSFRDDPNHCGDCGTVCASGVCDAGYCTPLGCAPGLVSCPYSIHFGAAGCYDLATNPGRCGSCDNACGGAGSRTVEACIEGVCVATSCLDGFVDCSGNFDCVDVTTDPLNCGTCGNACASGGCSAGSCTADDTTCAAGLAYCPARQINVGFDDEPEELPAGCYDLASDHTHCGSCDITCPSTVPCYGGQCTLPPCEGALSRCGASCVDFLSDPNYCGACDIVCAAGEVCDRGICGPGATCAAGLTYCSAKTDPVSQEAGCYDLSSDYVHCGACDASCPIASPGPMACIEGQCQKHCDPPRTLCENPASIHPDYCADVNSDPENCGACGNVCGGGICANGSCAPGAAPTAAPNAGVGAESPLVLQTEGGASAAQPAVTPTATREVSDATGSGGVSDAGGTSRAPRSRDRSAAGQTAKSGAAVAAPKSTLGWPFDPKAGQWTIVNGYRGEDEHAPGTAGSRNGARFALDFAVCRSADVAADDTCDLGLASGSDGSDADEARWDRAATQGADVRSPVDGIVAWVDGAASTCRSVGIDIAGHPGYRLALFPIDGRLERGQAVKRGKRIGTISTAGTRDCQGGDRLHMALYKPQVGAADDPVAGREGAPFAGDWAIAGCDYPDDKRTINQYRGVLAPCSAADATARGASGSAGGRA